MMTEFSVMSELSLLILDLVVDLFAKVFPQATLSCSLLTFCIFPLFILFLLLVAYFMCFNVFITK